VWVPVAVLAAAWAAWSGRLPARMATHWNGTGSADGFSSTTAFATALLLVAAAAALAATAVAATRPAAARSLLAGTGAASGGAAGIWLVTAQATLADPADARLGWRFVLFLAGLAWGAVAGAVAGRQPHPAPPVLGAVDPLDLSPTERAAYSTTLHAPVLLAVTVGAAAVVAVAAATTEPALWPAAAVPLVAGLLFGHIRVTADRRGLRLVAGLLGIPVKHIPLTDITAVEVAHIVPLEWGGWGYRVIPGRAALVLRGGPGLVLHLRDGRRFAVTLDDPRTPAALLTALRVRS
jgi:uncharacterized membrane protein YoaK (UPF0700 family)